MKKFMSYIAVIALILTFTACGNKDNEVSSNNPPESGLNSNSSIENNEENNKPEENKPEENKPEENKSEENKPVENKPEENKPVENKPVENKPVENKPVENKPIENKPVENKPVENKPVENKPVENKPEETSKTSTEILNALLGASKFEVNAPFTQDITAEMSMTTIGLSDEQFNTYVDNAVMYESMMMPSNQSLCIIKLKDASKVADVRKLVFDNCDPRKWICMSAEYVLVTDSGEYIMLIMSEKDTCTMLKDSFISVVGSTGEVLERTAE